jgi:SPP1 family predicted phage head-tail adaptor
METRFIDAGSLRTVLYLDDPVETADGAGGVGLVWSERAFVWGMLETARPALEAFADRTMREATHRIIIRHRDDVRAGQRFRKGSRNFRVEFGMKVSMNVTMTGLIRALQWKQLERRDAIGVKKSIARDDQKAATLPQAVEGAET